MTPKKSQVSQIIVPHFFTKKHVYDERKMKTKV